MNNEANENKVPRPSGPNINPMLLQEERHRLVQEKRE